MNALTKPKAFDMKTILLSLLLSLIVLCGCGNAHQAVVERYFHSVGLLYTGDGVLAPSFSCTYSAFERVPGGFNFVGAAHCLETHPKVVLIEDDSEGRVYKATLVAEGDQAKGYDFSVVRVSAPPGAFTIAPLGHNPRRISERVYTISSPLGIGRTYQEGTVSVLDIRSGVYVYDLVAPPHTYKHNLGVNILGLAPGSSGAAIMCLEQEAVCAIFVGILPGTMVAEPIKRFEQWWKNVQVGKEPRYQALRLSPLTKSL